MRKKNILEIRTRPSTKLDARTNIVCDTSTDRLGTYDWSVEVHKQLTNQSEELANLFAFQYETGCRISEALSVKYSDILRDASVKITGLKNSSDRIVNCSRIADYLLNCRKIRKNPFSTFNRFFIYRKWKNSGVSFQSNNSSKKSVTHALRQFKAENIRNIDSSELLISQSIGQKNQKNARFYGKSKKQK